MYENIRKPGWLKNTPVLLIRSLPAVYYFARHAESIDSDGPEKYYRMHIHYLGSALSDLGKDLKIDGFHTVARQFRDLPGTSGRDKLKMTETAVRNLTAGCTEARQALAEKREHWNPHLQQLYLKTVRPLQLILVDYQRDPGRLEKLHRMLTRTCNYQVDCISGIEDRFQRQILDADCIILTDIQPPNLHHVYEILTSLRKPVLAIIPEEGSRAMPAASVRHAGQLVKLGLDVLIHFITPIRLYTTIEKNYMDFYARTV